MLCVLQRVLFLDRPLLSWVTYSSTGATVLGEDGTVTKGRTSIRDREQQAQRELESFVLEKSVDWHNVC